MAMRLPRKSAEKRKAPISRPFVVFRWAEPHCCWSLRQIVLGIVQSYGGDHTNTVPGRIQLTTEPAQT